ncbi:MAG: lytic transglycosylase domain-containing protein [Myxococcota bacterium]
MPSRRPPAPSLLALALSLATPWVARADVYSWVDDAGTIHFSDVKKGESNAPKFTVYRGDDVDGFGGQPPLVLEMAGGVVRTLYAVDVDRYDAIFDRAAAHYRLPSAFLKAIAKVESNFNPRAVSNKAAKGLMQLIDETARRLSVEDPFDPEQSIFGGARYLRILANQFEGDMALTAAAYNAGPEAVKKAGGIPRFDETQRYVERVLTMMQHYQKGHR